MSVRTWSAVSGTAPVLLRCLPALTWMAAIIYSSHQAQPLGQSVAAPLDSLAHFALYAILFGLLWFAATGFRQLRRHPAAALIVAAAVAVPFAVSDELHQAFVRGRSASLVDLSVDVASVVAGAAFLRSADVVQRAVRGESGNPRSADEEGST